MAHTWKSAVVLGLFGAAIAAGCTVKTVDDDDDDGGSAGADGGTAGGGSGGKAGSAGSAGKAGGGGSSAGSAGKAGGGSGGDAGSETGGTAGTATAGTTSGGGEGGMTFDTEAECDPDEGQLANTPYPNCEPFDPENSCEACIQTSCCEISKECFSYAPGNVCGWGGPDETGEVNCYQDCIDNYIDENDGICDTEGEDFCLGECATEGCGQIGNQTQDMLGCMWENCATDCFGVDSCG
jgi:hypothetical protein